MIIKKCINRLLGYLGYVLTKPLVFDGSVEPYCNLLEERRIVDLERIASISLAIPGMITPRSGQILYSLCMFQETVGDVVEIGSWQGRSTSFLARATRDSGNGRFFAIDHFKGNIGKEKSYIVGKEDLSDLKSNFIENMETIKLNCSVNLLDMPNWEAAERFAHNQIRFLFIDGDHTYDGVSKDIELFFPKLCPGAIVVFDDFSAAFPGVLKAVEQLLQSAEITRCMSYQNTLVISL